MPNVGLFTDFQEIVKSVAEIAAKKAVEMDALNEMDQELLELVSKRGLLGVTIPEEYRGMGKGYAELVTLAEELGRVNAGLAISVAAHHMVANAIMHYGSEDQKKKWLGRLTSEVGVFALTEPTAGSDVASIRLKAEKDGDKFILNGRKTLITNATFGDVFLVIARTGEGSKGLTAFIVERNDGMEIRKLEASGMRGSGLAAINFKDVEVPAESVLGGEGNGLKVALGVLSTSRIVFAAIGLGIAERCLELALKYAIERKAFGQRIADFQGIQWMLAEVATEVEAARRLIYHGAEVAGSADATVIGAMCKLYAAKVAKKAADVAVEIFGGHGLIKGSAVERAYRDAKILDIGEGTSEIMKVIIGRHLITSASHS